MSKLQLRSTRSSRRRTASPPALEDATADVLIKKKSRTTNSSKLQKSAESKPDPDPPLAEESPHTTNEVDLSESDSSSEEFVRPAANLKVNAGGLTLRNGPSPEPDFSAIESNILKGVSRLSDSDSDDDDLEEVGLDPEPKPCNSTAEKESLSSKEDASTSVNLKESFKTNALKSNKSCNGKLSLKKEKPGKNENVSPQGNSVENTAKKPERTTRARKAPMSKSSGSPSKSEGTTNSKSTVSIKNQPSGQSSNKMKDDKRGKRGAPSKSSKSEKPKEDPKIENSYVKTEPPESLDNMDIAQLLALGEGLKMDMKSPVPSDSESEDWEEVDQAEPKQHVIPKEGVQITVNAPEFSWKRKKHRDQQACLQAEMNRAFNRVRRELQLLCHKASLLLWMAHGIFINNVINNDGVKAIALSLVPSDLSDLPKKPGRKYVEQLLKWFGKDFECSEGFPETHESSHSRPLGAVLAQHFSRKYAKSTRELIFMFVTILRAVGMDCRLIVSFQPMPLKPSSSELLSINAKAKRGKPSNKGKKEEEEASEDHSASDTKRTSKTAQLTRKSKPLPKDGKSSKYFRKSAPISTKPENTDVPKKESTRKRKSEPTSTASPVKTRGNRRKAAEKSYKEKSDSDSESDPDDPKPILSPKKLKLDEDSSQRLKEAAAKRLPRNRRSTTTMPVNPKSSKCKDASSQGSDCEQDSKPVYRYSVACTSKQSTSQKPSGSRRSRKSDSDSDFEEKPKSKQISKTNKSPPNKKQPTRGRPSKGSERKILSSDDDKGGNQLMVSGSDYWVEVYLKDEERWICIDVPSKKVDSSKQILLKVTQPVCYVIAFNSDGTLKDVTKRYSPKYSQVTVKQRVSTDWWEKTMKPFRPKPSRQEAAEDSEMNLVELDRPMPKTVAECKNHPLYVLKRHLLKFEAIYPPDSPSLGFVRSEPVYARQNVYTLHSREIWMKEAKVVRLGEQPYKIVKARPKWDRLSGKVITDLPLEVFGPWQVEDYVPPPAKDGKVPRNAYGNVELFKPSMLPKGTVHLQVPFLSRVAKKLRIDCAPAVVGFDYHSGGCHPTYDGFVVCEEFVDVLMDAWNKEIDESAKRREEKHEKRVYGNWRRLIKGLLIREHLKHRYDFKEEGADEPTCSQSLVNADAVKASRIEAENAPLPLLFPKLMANIKNQKSQRKVSSTKTKKNPPKSAKQKEGVKGKKGRGGRKRKNETSEEEEESEWDSETTSEDDNDMVLLSDEDSGSEFEDLKNKT
ncbi:DNA repair protein complementing XP-C cells-like protein [Frankliniella fusca]|uniref:DNA repair protein complementing XP-C cells-like protein n=1 Tax=Frankliniella fusca TaxID=407009 RepID=A0AAE1HQD9_9NEOP|nr:DNA repair protein complementing XP-C cells-like protein [Frankliniella fusca]